MPLIFRPNFRIEKEWTRRRNQKSRYTEIKPMEGLEYPTHPFRPDLCNSIAKMPKGFRDLALQAVLSVQMLQILERMSEWHTRTEHVHQKVETLEEMSLLQAHEPQVEAQEANRCLETLMSSGQGGGIERCLFYGLIAYCLEVFAQKKFSPELYWVVQDLPMALEQIEPDPLETECLMWVSVVAVGRCKGSLSQKGSEIMDKLLEDHPRLKEWDKVEETLRKFFWYDSLAVEWKRCWSAAVIRRKPARERATDSGTPSE
jgi:hypothetical protein